MSTHGLNPLPTFVADPEASAADDAEVLRLLDQLAVEGQAELYTYVEEWEAGDRAKPPHWIRPPLPWRVLLPVNLALVAVIAVALAWR